MLKGEKILITGPAGQIATPITKALAKDNDVWGIARFSQPGSREEVESWGVTTRQVELGTDQFGDLPHEKIMRNIELLGTKVVPELEKRGHRVDYSRLAG